MTESSCCPTRKLETITNLVSERRQEEHPLLEANRWNCVRQSDSSRKMRSELLEKYGNIRFLGFVLFVLASMFCLYKIYDLQGKPSDAYKRPVHVTSLKLVSIIGRHGDRAPSDGFPEGDMHGNKIQFFWPNGYSNLTDIGRMRQFRIGLELRRRYRDFSSFSSNDYLAFSSAMTRCQDSLEQILRGFFQIQWPIEMGRRFVDLYNVERSCSRANMSQAESKACQERPNKGKNLYLPTGSGSPSEYKNISIDTSSVPTLDWRYLESNCKAWDENVPSLLGDLMLSRSISNLKGVKKLAEVLKKNYKLDFNMQAANEMSTIEEEIRLARTAETVQLGQHYYSWVNERAPDYRPELGVTLFDLFEQLVVLYYHDRLDEKLKRIELGPIVTSLVTSQKQALVRPSNGTTRSATGGVESPPATKQFDSPGFYANKKIIFYSTHDGTIQTLIDMLNITNIDSDNYETRFSKYHRSDDVDRFLAGLEMVQFGASLAFELYETEMKERENGVWRVTKRFAHVQAALYNEEDVVTKPVAYKRLKFGSMCREKFKKIYKNKSNYKHILNNKFYDEDFPLDSDYSCPFELFKNITSSFIISHDELNGLCART